MQLHHHIAHRVCKHTEKIIGHVHKHHQKYILGAGILSGAAIFKLIGVIAIFFGATYLGGGTSLGGDYYDAEWYLLQETAGKHISIYNDYILNDIITGFIITDNNFLGCTSTGDVFSGTTGVCP